MIATLKRLWNDAAASEQKADNVPLAVAALMVEVMRMDDRIEQAEEQTILRALQQRFHLQETEVLALIEQARRATDAANDLHRFTSQVVNAFSTEERGRIVEQLWSVAMADGYVDPYEEQLIRRAAELLGVSHRSFITAKLAAEREAG